MDIIHESFWSDEKYHKGWTLPWEDAWLKPLPPHKGKRYYTCCRQLTGIDEWRKTHLNAKGKPSCQGWHNSLVGAIIIDVDSSLRRDETLNDSRKRAKRIIAFLDAQGVKRESWTLYFSGSKGFHIVFLYQAFGPAIIASELYHETAIKIALQSLTGGIEHDTSLNQSIRLVRSANSQHENGRYKIPLNVDEIDLADEHLFALASAPRLGLRTVPSTELDMALARLFEQRLTAYKLESNNATQKTEGGSNIPTDILPPPQLPDPSPQLKQKLLDALDENIKLKLAFEGGRKSYSEDAIAFLHRLALAGWSIEDAVAILPIQPGYLGRIRSVDWIWKTARKAFNYAANAWKSPVKSAMEEPANSERPNWLDLSVAFLERTGLGTKGKKTWEQHVAAAEKYARWNKQPGSWSAPYFLCWKPEFRAIASKRTWMRKNRLLIETGLLKREQKGWTGYATHWIVKMPALEDANDLIFRARVAVVNVRKALENRKGNRIQGVGRELDGKTRCHHDSLQPTMMVQEDL
jgi:hypothetical protein